MAENKHAQIRYLAIDTCLRNTGRHYTFNDLLEACNSALAEHYPKGRGIQRRQLFKDLDFIKTAYQLEIKTMRDGKKIYYRYENPKNSIRDKSLNETEKGQLKEALAVLSRFKGLPQFEWIPEISAKLESGFELQTGARHIIGFEQNTNLRGLNHISPLFNAILNQRVVQIKYKSFKSAKSEPITIHPYYLKQFNNRWFCFGLNEKYGGISNYPLDRIDLIKETGLNYLPNQNINFETYFNDVVGVTVEGEKQQVLLKVNKQLWPYIETKPLHSTQKVKKLEREYVLICMELKLNYEFESILLSHAEKIEVLEPEHLRKKLSDRIKKAGYYKVN